MKLSIYWTTKDEAAKKRIRARFGIPREVSVNGETEADIREEDMPLLQETERRGFIRIRRKPH